MKPREARGESDMASVIPSPVGTPHYEIPRNTEHNRLILSIWIAVQFVRSRKRWAPFEVRSPLRF
ncbi:hypothetical protein MUK42_15503 [Musa troglodytarum]|uniref:Uncharacterized protein n=1 Tax=Musa troglodytarum TaxID=320322 RepID=A0A9E7KS22_9LILI|nr:hypothetical protein MUK42_15503 [Musa troglodytarum]